MVVERGADDALGDVVGHTHSSVGYEEGEATTESFRAIIGEEYAYNPHQHEAQIGNRRNQNVEGGHEVGIVNIVAHHIVDATQGEVDYNGTRQDFPPLR